MLHYPLGSTSAGIQLCQGCRKSQIWSMWKQIIIWYAFLDLKTLTGVLLEQAKWRAWKIDEKMLPFISWWWWWWFTGYSSEQCEPHQQELFICSLPSSPNTTGWDLHLCLFQDVWANKLGDWPKTRTMRVPIFTSDLLVMTEYFFFCPDITITICLVIKLKKSCGHIIKMINNDNILSAGIIWFLEDSVFWTLLPVNISGVTLTFVADTDTSRLVATYSWHIDPSFTWTYRPVWLLVNFDHGCP